MKQDISNEIEKIISYCKSKECDECKYKANDDLCNLHNPTAWNVNKMNEKEAIETYKNFLDDISKNGGCTIDIDFQHKKEYEAMWKILDILKEQQAEIESLEQEKQEAWEEWNNIDNYCEQEKQKYKAKIEKKDNAVRNIVQRLENDIKNITKTKADGKHSDYYSRNRLKAYKTKTKEIKEYIEKQYFNQKIEKGE